MVLKGVNIGGWLSQTKRFNRDHYDTFITEKDIIKLKKWGVNTIRIPFDYNCILNDTKGLNFNSLGIDYIKKITKLSTENNLICILDFHITPWHHFLDKNVDFFKDQKIIDQHITILEYIISNIKDYKNIYLELLNEPQCENDELLNEFYKLVINRIRKKAYKNKLIIESNLAGSTDTFDKLEDFLNYDNIAFSFHFYHPIQFTHQKAYWTDKGSKNTLNFPYMNNNISYDENYLLKKLKPVIDFTKKTDKEVFCGEFGVYLEAPYQSRLKWIECMLKIFKEYNIGFLYWTYKNLDFGIINNQKQYKYLDEYDNEENTDLELLNLLKKYF